MAKEQATNLEQFLGFFNTFLLVFAGIALFVGAFLIFNTFSILVGQRTRELALLRAIGASRRQVNLSVMGEAVFVGLFGSVLGLLIGVPLAAGLYGLLGALGVSLPSSALQLLPRTIIVSLVVGTVVTVVSAILPAYQASKIAPVAAMADDPGQTPTSLRRRAVAGGSVLTVGLLLLAGGLFAHAGIAAVGAGAAVTFVGVAMLAPFVAAPLARALGAPLPNITGHLAKENAARNPRRTAATASALMVGLAVVAAIATLGASALASFNGIFDRAITADYVLVSSGGSGSSFSAAVEPAAQAAPGVVAVSPLRSVPFHDGGATRTVSGIDPVAGPQVFRLDMVTGSISALAKGQVLIDTKAAKSHHLKVGDTLQMGFAATGVKSIVVGGTYKTNQFVGNYAFSSQLAAANVNQVQDDALFVKTQASGPAESSALAGALSSYPNVSVKTAAQFKADQKKSLDSVLAIVYVLLSIIIALIGVVNTLALSVIERTREIGLMRAIGAQRRQIKRMIRGEAVLVSLIGAILGLVLGTALGAAIVSALSSTGIDTLAIPVSTIVVVVLLTAVFGVVAAVWPARRAANLDVLQAIATA